MKWSPFRDEKPFCGWHPMFLFTLTVMYPAIYLYSRFRNSRRKIFPDAVRGNVSTK